MCCDDDWTKRCSCSLEKAVKFKVKLVMSGDDNDEDDYESNCCCYYYSNLINNVYNV